jgi:hypothetical protein
MQIEQHYLTEEHIKAFQQRMEAIIDAVRQHRTDPTAAKQLANEDEDTTSVSDLGSIDQTDAELSSIMDQSAAVRAASSENGNNTGTSTPLSVDLTSDAEYFTPLGSPDDSRRSSVVIPAVPQADIRITAVRQVRYIQFLNCVLARNLLVIRHSSASQILLKNLKS